MINNNQLQQDPFEMSGDTASASELRFKEALELSTGLSFDKVRPAWLVYPETKQLLELDMFHEALMIAIEYDGPHHYTFPNKYHRTEAEFKRQLSRDAYKAEACKERGMKLCRVRAVAGANTRVELADIHSQAPELWHHRLLLSQPALGFDELEKLLEVKALVGLLDGKRADSYPSWMQVGWCLHNIDAARMLPVWIEFSRRSPKFTEGRCEELWAGMRDHGLHVGSLHKWAKEDNPMGHRALLSLRVTHDVRGCNGSHNAVAAIAAKLLRGRYVCALPNGKLWYAFDGTLWHEDPEAIRMRHELSTTVREQFIHGVHKLANDLSIDDMQSTNSSNTNVRASNEASERLLRVANRLQDAGFKDGVMRETREYFYDPNFLNTLDSNPNLIAFTNGVWQLKEKCFRGARPEDYLSLSTGFPYTPEVDAERAERVAKYWATLHPDEEQSLYVRRMFSRQLYGDSGSELFHVHAGHLASAANGKTKMFEVLEKGFKGYVRKFGVEMLTAKQRIEPGKPMPEFDKWRGLRLLYCTEPNHDETLNSGVMKDLTGGEMITYRLLQSNKMQQFRPQFKLHIMCNDPPQVDGSDSGVKRRIRKIDYISRFVDKDCVDESKHMYARDPDLIDQFANDDLLKMELARDLLSLYEHSHEFEMPLVIQTSSTAYINDNDPVSRFVDEYVTRQEGAYFTLEQAKAAFKTCDYFNGRVKTLKNDLQKLLGRCDEQKWIEGKNRSSVFMNYNLAEPEPPIVMRDALDTHILL